MVNLSTQSNKYRDLMENSTQKKKKEKHGNVGVHTHVALSATRGKDSPSFIRQFPAMFAGCF